MKFAIAALVTVGASVLSSCTGNRTVPPQSVADPAIQAAVVHAVQADRKLYGGKSPVPGVLVGIWDGDGHTYIRTFGYADRATHRPLTVADHFRIGSNTKTFVIATLLQLVDERRLSLDDPVSRFSIGVAVPNGNKITIRELCQMRSGLFEAYDTPQLAAEHIRPAMTFDPRTLVAWAMKQRPYFAPGQGYHYTNTNYLILGLIVESLTHDSIGDQIRKRLLVPFRLTQTFYPQTQAMPNPWARGYGLDKHRRWEDVSGTIPVSLMGAAGAMISNMHDMKRWIGLVVTGKTSAPATFRALTECIPTGQGNLAFGLGLGCSAGWYGYTGGLPGYNTANYYFPATGATIVAWVDVQANSPNPGVANAVFRDIAHVITPTNVPFEGVGKGL
ncbi:MAG TPA: serine hydrolase domain-containing protein [Candidatus Cybelea sp.]|nr:serine hydrolase domain-containing protein [Candidatus Cybelea sp.]